MKELIQHLFSFQNYELNLQNNSIKYIFSNCILKNNIEHFSHNTEIPYIEINFNTAEIIFYDKFEKNIFSNKLILTLSPNNYNITHSKSLSDLFP